MKFRELLNEAFSKNKDSQYHEWVNKKADEINAQNKNLSGKTLKGRFSSQQLTAMNRYYIQLPGVTGNAREEFDNTDIDKLTVYSPKRLGRGTYIILKDTYNHLKKIQSASKFIKWVVSTASASEDGSVYVINTHDAYKGSDDASAKISAAFSNKDLVEKGTYLNFLGNLSSDRVKKGNKGPYSW